MSRDHKLYLSFQACCTYTPVKAFGAQYNMTQYNIFSSRQKPVENKLLRIAILLDTFIENVLDFLLNWLFFSFS